MRRGNRQLNSALHRIAAADDFATHKAELLDRVRNAQVPRNMPNCRGFVDALGIYAQNLSPEVDSPRQQIDRLLER